MTCDVNYIFSPGPLSIPASLLNRPPWRNKFTLPYLTLPYCRKTDPEETQNVIIFKNDLIKIH